MQYVLLIHAAESRFAHAAPADIEAVLQSYNAYSRELFATGRAGDAAPLQATHTATSVRVREGKRAVQDGPFAETREQLGGYYSLDAESEAEALDWAARIPDAKGGTVEVRPVMAMGGPSPAPAPATLTAATHKQYLLLIYDREADWAAMSEAERGALFGRYMQFSKEIRASGNLIAGEPLAPAAKARSVSVVDGRRVVRDGPFAETREQLGGYYRVWARDLDEAIALAARIPSAEIGTVEVRPVMDLGPRG
ncbi:MAG: YciI family protein [Polyangiales bacterium]